MIDLMQSGQTSFIGTGTGQRTIGHDPSANGSQPDHSVFDPAEVRRALSLLIPPGQVVEVRVLKGALHRSSRCQTHVGYFNNLAAVVAELSHIKSAGGVYLTLNPVDPQLLARANNRFGSSSSATANADIQKRCWLLIDCDPCRPSGISATDEEHDAAIQRARDVAAYLRDCGWPEPIVADSGNGAHLLYPIDLPADDDGLIERCLEALSAMFSDDRVTIDSVVHNPARIWKLYGTRACKGDATPDRPHRMSRVLSAPDSLSVVEREKLDWLAASVQTPRTKEKSQPGNGQTFDLDSFIERHNLHVSEPKQTSYGRVWRFHTSPLCDHGNDGPFLIQFHNGAIAAGCHHDHCQWNWHDVRAKYEPNAGPTNKGDVTRSPVITCMADVQPESVDWLWPGRIAVGKLTTIYGAPGLGKSFVTQDIAARVSRGAEWPDKCGQAAPLGDVMLLSAEDGIADTVRPRLGALGADCQRIKVLNAIKVHDGDSAYDAAVDLSRDIAGLRQAIADTPGCKLVVIDPISAYLGKTDSHNNSEVRSVLMPLAKLAEEMQVAIVAVSHVRKGDGSASDRANGSVAFVAAARAAWIVVADENDPDRRLMLSVKNNLAADGTGLAYTIQSAGSDGAPIVCWESEPVKVSADEAVTRDRKGRGRPPDDKVDAIEFLQRTLAGGPRLKADVMDEAEANLINDRTLRRAKGDLRVASVHLPPDKRWYWQLPDEPKD